MLLFSGYLFLYLESNSKKKVHLQSCSEDSRLWPVVLQKTRLQFSLQGCNAK